MKYKNISITIFTIKMIFFMMVYDNIYFEAQINRQYICIKIMLNNYILH